MSVSVIYCEECVLTDTYVSFLKFLYHVIKHQLREYQWLSYLSWGNKKNVLQRTLPFFINL
jgi:late competence protein required for DNA uptake (superfamily II DNA/RNA helicase)